MFVVYCLYSEAYNKIYIGYTSDLIDRFSSHNSKSKKGYTVRYRPWIVSYVEFLETKSEAMKREKQLKSFRGREYLRGEIEKIKCVSGSYQPVGWHRFEPIPATKKAVISRKTVDGFFMPKSLSSLKILEIKKLSMRRSRMTAYFVKHPFRSIEWVYERDNPDLINKSKQKNQMPKSLSLLKVLEIKKLSMRRSRMTVFFVKHSLQVHRVSIRTR